MLPRRGPPEGPERFRPFTFKARLTMPHLTHETLEGAWHALPEENATADAAGRVQGARPLDARWAAAGARCHVAGGGASSGGAGLHARSAWRDAP